MDISLEDKVEIINVLIQDNEKKMEYLDKEVRRVVQSGRWSANEATDQAEIILLKNQTSKMRLYLEMIEMNKPDSEEYKLGLKKINKLVIIYNHKIKNWK